MSIPLTLQYKLEQFRHCGRVIKYSADLFATTNWAAVFIGQEVVPRDVDPLLRQYDPQVMLDGVRGVAGALRHTAESLPTHADYIAQHCRAAGMSA